MSHMDLSVCGSPTPRAASRRAVSARHQKVVQKEKDGHVPNMGAAVITREQLALAKKLAYYEAEVGKSKAKVKHNDATTKDKVDPKIKGSDVPRLKLNLLRNENSGSYHITRGADTSRSVMSWGDNSYRNTRPPEISKLDTRNQEEQSQQHAGNKNKEQKQEKKTREESKTPNREDDGGEFEVEMEQTLGFNAYESEEERIKRTRQEQAVEEQMLQDLSQPQTEDESYTLRTPWATSNSERADFYALNEIPRVKRLDQSLHTTSKEFTYAHIKDRGIERRLKFNLRIVSRCGRDSLRDLFGFYFSTDDSITVYEYKEIGTRYKAAPLFPRARYYHPRGRWIGNPYNLRDIRIGRSIHLPTCNNTALSPSITRAPLVTLRITLVEEEHVLSLVHDGCRIEERSEKEELLKEDTLSQAEIETLYRTKLIQDHIKRQLRSRPVRSLVGMGHYFVLHDKNKDGFWRADELQAVLRTFRIQLYEEDFLMLWSTLDEDGSGLVDVGEFLRGLLGDMSEARVGLVHRAWVRMDPGRAGQVSFTTVRHFYNPALSLEPSVESGGSREELMEEFLACFNSGPLDQRITYCEFLDYCTAISLSETDDIVFATYMKHCWNI